MTSLLTYALACGKILGEEGVYLAKKYEMDFTEGSILKKMIICALPIIGVNILQLLFTAADVAVLGIFTNDHAVAAVGSTTQITNMLIGFFVG